MTTPTPTVIEEDRQAAADYLMLEFDPNPSDLRKMRQGFRDDDSLVQAFARHRIAAIELGERRAEAAVVAYLTSTDLAGDWPEEWGVYRYNAAAFCIERGDHRSKPA